MTRTHWRPWVLNPIWHALFAWGLTIVTIPLGEVVQNTSEIVRTLFLLIFLGIVVFTFVAIIVSVYTYPTSERFLKRMIFLYLSLVLVFATTYFWMMVSFDPQRPISGINSPWEWLSGTEGRMWRINLAALTAVDCFHYSCVTITTLGFGDMHPIHWVAKLLTDLEVFTGVGVIAVGLGRFFTIRDKRV